MSESPVTVELLLVEDSAADARLTREALRDACFPGRLAVVEDGAQALSYLRREGPYRDAPRPDVVLLDINLPRMDGRELLRRMRGDPALQALRVVVLTTSEAEADRQAAREGNVDAYLVKPIDGACIGAALAAVVERAR